MTDFSVSFAINLINEMSSYVKIEVCSAGEGKYPKKGDLVSIHYRASFADSLVEFDSTFDREPFAFNINCDQVFPGLDYAVSQLSCGERVKATIPPSLAYGTKGFSILGIPPNSTLIFDITLLSIT